jgi:4-amino-4-deoxy-L-arabinose transferase-like glycosyltransferase
MREVKTALPVPGQPIRRWVLLLLFIAFALRVSAAILVERHVAASGRTFLIEGDANGYWELGRRIAAGEDYEIHSPPRRILRTPGFPLLLAASIRLFGESVFRASLLLAGVGTVCCWLTYTLARPIAGHRSALAALALAAIAPLQIGSSVQVLSECWFSVWLLLSLIPLRSLLREGNADQDHQSSFRSALLHGLLAGFAAGFGVLVRPGWVLWPATAAIGIAVWGGGSWVRRLAIMVCLTLGCWLTLLPWAVRNYFVCGHLVHTSLWSGPSLYDGLNPQATGASNMEFFDRDQLMLQMDEYSMNEEYKRRVWTFVQQEPLRAVELGLLKAGRYLSPILQAETVSSPAVSLVCLVWHGIAGFLVIRGSWLLWRAGLRPAVLLLWAPFLQFLLIHLVFVGSVRYRLPVEFPLLVLAGVGLSGWRPFSVKRVADHVAGRDA